MTIILTKNNKQRESVRIAGPQITKLRQLTDVDAADLNDNEVIVYDEEQDIFVVKRIPNIDGGTF